jgi:hypothetical protein
MDRWGYGPIELQHFERVLKKGIPKYVRTEGGGSLSVAEQDFSPLCQI